MIFSILKSLSLGVWLGALLMLGIAVAGPIFQQSPSKTLAGTINGIILGRMNNIEWVCGSIAFLGSLVLLVLNWSGEIRTLRIVESGAILVMLGLLWVYSGSMTNRMTELRGVIKDFDHPIQTTEYVQAKAEFDDLHHTYTRLVGINMMLIVGTFVVSMITAVRK
ncbi:MAG: DUF4149 domain-containing protein [Candidatus Kapaibacterium sp.]|jgi:hypothetical protein